MNRDRSDDGPGITALGHYLRTLLGYRRVHLLVAFGVMLACSLSEGIGLLLLLPLLYLLNPPADGVAVEGVAGLLADISASLQLTPTLPLLLTVFVALVTGRALLIGWRDLLLTDLRLRFVDNLRVELHNAIGRASWQFLLQQKPSDLSYVLNSDVDRVGEATYHVLNIAVRLLMTVVYTAIACVLSPLITLLALLSGALLLLLLRPQNRRASLLGKHLTEAGHQVFGALSEFLNGIKLAKSYAAESRHHQAFVLAVDRLRREVLRFTRSQSAARAVYQVGAAAVLSILIYVALSVIQLPLAELLVLILVFARLLPMMSSLQRDYQYLLFCLPAYAVARDMLARCEAAAEQLPGGDGWQPGLVREIRLAGVGFNYDLRRTESPPALADLELSIPAKKTTALVGRSGSGKSTLADLLTGLLQTSSGRILIDGETLSADRLPAWRQAVAYVPQETFLFHDTVRANLTWAVPAADEAALWRVLESVAAKDFVAALPRQLDTVIGERGIRLSGGERQRLALARALLRRPSLLILDEATSALDNEHERRIQRAIDELHGELTIVVVAHRLSTVRHADQIVVMEAGRVVETGCWEQLVEHSGGRFRALLDAGNTTEDRVGSKSKASA